MVIVSLVRSNENGNLGFLRILNRVNVLLSRAMHGMYLLGNADCLRMCKKDGGLWVRLDFQPPGRNGCYEHCC